MSTVSAGAGIGRVAAPGWRPMALMFASTGMLHFVRPAIFEPLIPRRLGHAGAWVAATGAAEIACAAGLFVPRTRRTAALASAALLVAVFPGNVQMTVSAFRSSRASTAYKVGTALRLPLQLPLVSWALRVHRETAES